MWSSFGLKFILLSVTTPWGIAVLFAGFLISCLSRVFLRRSLLKNLYMIISFGPLLYLVVVGVVLGSSVSTLPGETMFAPMPFAVFFAVPFSVGWLLGWPIAVLLQLAAQGPSSSAPERS
jgi:hypothetical protein